MHSDWFVEATGDPIDIACVAQALEGSDQHSFTEEEPGKWRFRSVLLAGIAPAEYERALALSREVMDRVTEALGVAAGRRIRLARGMVGRTRSEGNFDMYIEVPPAVLTLTAHPPTVLINGVPQGEPAAERFLRMAEANPHFALAIHCWGLDRSWANLYKSFDAIREGVGGVERLTQLGWISTREIRRFRHTADNYHATGDEARHAKLSRRPPTNPMTLPEADALIRRLLEQWVEFDPEMHKGGHKGDTH